MLKAALLCLSLFSFYGCQSSNKESCSGGVCEELEKVAPSSEKEDIHFGPNPGGN